MRKRPHDSCVYFFDLGIALKAGVNAAIFYRWLILETDNQGHEHPFWEDAPYLLDGRYWVRRSIQDFLPQFPFWSARQCNSAIAAAVKHNIVSRIVHNSHSFERTYSYSPN